MIILTELYRSSTKPVGFNSSFKSIAFVKVVVAISIGVGISSKSPLNFKTNSVNSHIAIC